MDGNAIRKIQDFVQRNVKNEFTLAELADSVGYSPFHLTREYKAATNQSVMEYAREQRILCSAKEISSGRDVCDVAMEYGFDTHAGFTKAFVRIFGCTPMQYYHHVNNINSGGDIDMQDAKIRIRPICKDDVNDLWENVYSAMTPRQIVDFKILPFMESFEKKEGIHLVAEVDRKVVMALPMMRIFSHPVGFLFDNCFVLSTEENNLLMERLLDEMAIQCRCFGISTLAMWQPENSKHTEAFQHFGFVKVFASGGYDYLMKAI